MREKQAPKFDVRFKTKDAMAFTSNTAEQLDRKGSAGMVRACVTGQHVEMHLADFLKYGELARVDEEEAARAEALAMDGFCPVLESELPKELRKRREPTMQVYLGALEDRGVSPAQIRGVASSAGWQLKIKNDWLHCTAPALRSLIQALSIFA